MKKRSLLRSYLILGTALCLSTPAFATASITWVSRTGVDSGTTCPITAPCRTLQYAHDQTAAGGTLTVLDSGEYSPITISKAITIRAKGVAARVTAVLGNNAVTIAAGATDKVRLEGLDLDAAGFAANPLRINSGLFTYVIDCSLSNSGTGSSGIAITNNTANARLFVQHSSITNNTSYGVNSAGFATGQVVSILDTLIDGNGTGGVFAQAGSIVGMAQSVINASATSIAITGGSQVISIGPSNIISGTGAFTSSLPFN